MGVSGFLCSCLGCPGGHEVLMAPLCPVLEPQPPESPARRMVLIKTIETRDGQVRTGPGRIGGAPPGRPNPAMGLTPKFFCSKW